MAKELGKMTCNFGKKVTAAMRSQEKGPGDCLTKTQDFAKSKDDV